jgi:hypothetical protein
MSTSTGSGPGDPLLPEQTTDDSDRGWGERQEDASDSDDLERFLRERPPHHGD